MTADAVEVRRRDERSSRLDTDKGSEATDNPAPHARRSFPLLAGIACTVLGVKLIAIAALGSSMPIADQWDGEAANLYIPYLKGTLAVGDLFAPHNEHRIFLYRLVSLLHLELAGEWNTRLEMIFGAIVHTAAITWLAALLMPLVAPQRRMILACFVALLFAMPLGFENMLSGFQCQVYLMLLFGIAALAAVATAKPFSMRWFGGLAAAILGYLSFATGVATVLAAAALVAVQLLANARPRSRHEYAGVAVLVVTALAMIAWTASSAHALSTPWTVVQGLLLLVARVIVALVPCAWYCRHTIARRAAISDRAWVAVGICAWVAIQIAMLAYGRGTVIAVRYFDMFLFIYPVALVAVLAFADEARRRRFAVKGAVAWVFTVVLAVAALGYLFVLGSVDWSRSAAQQVEDVRTYFATNNPDDLKKFGSGHTFNLAYPDSRRQAGILANPDIRAILPAEFRPADADNAAVRKRLLLGGKLSAMTSVTVHAVLVSSPVLLALGIGLFFAVGTQMSLSDRRVE